MLKTRKTRQERHLKDKERQDMKKYKLKTRKTRHEERQGKTRHEERHVKDKGRLHQFGNGSGNHRQFNLPIVW